MKRAILLIMIFLAFTTASQCQHRSLKDSVFAYICQINILHPNIVMRQAILETGWFRSPYLMKKNNLFGFRNKQYLTFNDWKASIDYYKKWQSRRYKNHQEDYYHFLVRIKYAAKGYVNNLKRVNFTENCK